MKISVRNTNFAGTFYQKPPLVKYLFCLFLFFRVVCVCAQSEPDKFISRFKTVSNAPEGLLSARCAVLFTNDYAPEDLEKIQKVFQQTGIDAVTWVPADVVTSGWDIKNAFSSRFARRSIKFLIFIRKDAEEFQLWFLRFNPRNCWSNPLPSAWMVHGPRLQELLISMFRSLTSSQKKQNFLINDYPEKEPSTSMFSNTRNESLIATLKPFKIAVPGLGDRDSDKEIADYFTANYHSKYEIVSDTISDKELVQKGFRYVLRYVHAPGVKAKQMLGFEIAPSESAIASVTWPNGSMQLKTISSLSVVYKFYFKDLDDKNLYFGTKWDADISWQDALRNHIESYRATGKIN